MSHDGWDIISGVGMTALAAAAARAIESTRPDALIRDPFAAAFVAAAHSPLPLAVRWPSDGQPVSEIDAILLRAAHYIGARSRFFDDWVTGAVGEGVRQVVVLAAGLDTRAFRMAWPDGVRMFEIDQPKVVEFKASVLHGSGAKPRCERHVVAVDLREDWPAALRGAGFDAGTPCAWLAEGLLPYLPTDAEQRLFEYVGALSATGSRLGVEHTLPGRGIVDSGGLEAIREVSGFDLAALVHTGDRWPAAAWLSDRGWRTRDEPAVAAAQRYGRDLADPRLAGLPGPALNIAEQVGYLTARRTG